MKDKIKPFKLESKTATPSAELQVFVSELNSRVEKLKEKYESKADIHSMGRTSAYSDVLLIIKELTK